MGFLTRLSNVPLVKQSRRGSHLPWRPLGTPHHERPSASHCQQLKPTEAEKHAILGYGGVTWKKKRYRNADRADTTKV
ncbi:MAG: hypothetical protein LBT00_12890, partial [Spirochaetaceae bacterium]|nr:hypothetical protein [Spirochaetaceae bacterium]